MSHNSNISVIILAAGKGTRLLRDLYTSNNVDHILPKPLQPICGKPIIEWLIASLLAILPADTPIYVVVGLNQIPFYYLSEKYGLGRIRFCTQFVPDGTGGAVRTALNTFFLKPRNILDNFMKQHKILICPGDVPFIHPETIKAFIKSSEKYNHKLSILGLVLEDPYGYGRLQLKKSEGGLRLLESIIEEKDCTTDEERSISLCNSGFILANVNYLRDDLLPYLTKEQNAQKEYYLTDCVAIARTRWDDEVGYHACEKKMCNNDHFFRGINTLEDLKSLESKYMFSCK
jgi:bifunctional UDP-N-acetylglucosamine pyrophosphorylase/glucosamine-1-phosphate N-acetyltransferase